ncbi:hypothetical protein D3C84_879630 [compost metagenome]
MLDIGVPPPNSACRVCASCASSPEKLLSDSKVSSVGTSALKECPEPTGRILPEAWRMICTSSSRFFGASRSSGRQLCTPDQLRQGIGRGVSAAQSERHGNARQAPSRLARCNS